MKRLLFGIVALIALSPASLRAEEEAPWASEVIVIFKKDAAPAKRAAAMRAAGRSEKDLSPSRFTPQLNRIKTAGAEEARQLIETLKKDPTVAIVEPNYTVQAFDTIPNDTNFAAYQYGLRNTGQTILNYLGNSVSGTAGADIKAYKAWDYTTGSTSVVVAVIDSGLKVNHPDLSSNVWVNPGETPGDSIDNDGDGVIDNVNGVNFTTSPWNNNITDGYSHGTHIAGIIAAQGNNNAGVAGVTWSTKIMALKFLNSFGQGSIANGIDAINFAVSKGVKVMNLSWGTTNYSAALAAAVSSASAAGITIVGSAGNFGETAGENAKLVYPASLPGVISVTSSGNQDDFSAFSSHNASVTICAPGDGIWSTYIGPDYFYNDGTSMSAGFVSGAAALILALEPATSGTAMKTLLSNSADDLTAVPGGVGYDQYFGHGRLNVYRAVLMSDISSPTVSISSPTNGATISGSTTIIAGASDNRVVSRVDFYVDGVLKSSDTTAPFQYVWPSTAHSNGSHTIQARAYDPTGNMGSHSITLTASNASNGPSVSITSPSDGATISADAQVSVSASTTAVRVDFYVDNVLVSSDTAAPFAFVFTTSGRAFGAHSVRAVALDAANQSAQSQITLNIAPEATTVPPFVNLFNPSRNESVTITCQLRERARLRITLYDREGREVGTLIDEDRDAGTHSAVWRGRNSEGRMVSSGVYPVLIKIGGRLERRKIIVVR